jgi:hypothetical protein
MIRYLSLKLNTLFEYLKTISVVELMELGVEFEYIVRDKVNGFIGLFGNNIKGKSLALLNLADTVGV